HIGAKNLRRFFAPIDTSRLVQELSRVQPEQLVVVAAERHRLEPALVRSTRPAAARVRRKQPAGAAQYTRAGHRSLNSGSAGTSSVVDSSPASRRSPTRRRPLVRMTTEEPKQPNQATVALIPTS